MPIEREPLIQPHGGYRKLKSFQIAQLIYDLTVSFCNHFVDRYSRTHDQMVQAARRWQAKYRRGESRLPPPQRRRN